MSEFHINSFIWSEQTSNSYSIQLSSRSKRENKMPHKRSRIITRTVTSIAEVFFKPVDAK